ncbi:MAG: Fe-S cluster protein [Clostridia bacterium]|nr:MAG: Fe-S cluster protein [Clostridia bacterium]
MYLEDIKITRVSPCWADAAKIRLQAEMSRDIAEIMPYLNSVLSNATYNPHSQTLTFMKEGRLLTLYADHLTMAKALNTTDARQVLDWLKDLINDTYRRRAEIEPCYETRSRPTALQIYQWLPRTNCRECGEVTCLAFAARLLLGEQSIGRSRPLFTGEYRHLKEAMLELVGALGYDVPQEA